MLHEYKIQIVYQDKTVTPISVALIRNGETISEHSGDDLDILLNRMSERIAREERKEGMVK
jgi:hypothetical protein